MGRILKSRIAPFLICAAVGVAAALLAPQRLTVPGPLVGLLIAGSGALFVILSRRSAATRATQLALTEQSAALIRAATNHAILMTDRAGVLTLFNIGAENMLQYRSEDLVGRCTADMFFEPGQLAEAAAEHGVSERYAEVVAASVRDRHWTRDWVWLRADGAPLVVQLSVTSLLDESGEPVSYLGIATDMTTEVAARTELSRTEARWRTLLANLPDTMVLLVGADLVYRVAMGSAPAGFVPRSAVGRHVRQVASARHVEHLEQTYLAALAGRRSELELEEANGQIYDLVAMPLVNARGQSEALVIVRNVTVERSRARSLDQAHERFRRLFDESPTGSALIGLDGRFVRVNPALSQLFGRESDSLTGRPVAAVAQELAEAEQAQLMTNFLTNPTARRLDTELQLTISGRPLFLEVTTVVLREADGEAESILASLVDVSERRQNAERLLHLADHDPLTGLANRRRFDREVTAHLERCRRYGVQGAVIMLDLDRFKQINDTLGHGAGDALIVSTADLLRRRLRTTDTIARLGGDEFAVLLPNADRHATESVAASIVSLVRKEVHVFDGTQQRSVSTSVGVVQVSDAELSTEDLLAAADLAMYEAKEAGRDRYVMSDRVLEPEAMRARRPWSERIEHALTEDRFVLHAQALYDLPSQNPAAVEVLLRMVDDDGGLIMPMQFLHGAERSGLIGELDRWVLRAALDEFARADAPRALRLHVNLSVQTASDPGFADHVLAELRRTGFGPDRLVFELNEKGVLAHADSVTTFVERVTGAGCRIALDDFSSGFGSFSYLRHLDFRYVKLSADLIGQQDEGGTEELILASVVSLAHKIGKQVVATSIDSVLSEKAAGKRDVDLMQGYHLAAPGPLAELLGQVGSGSAMRLA